MDPAKGDRASRIGIRLASFAATLVVIALYVLVLTRGHIPVHLPLISH
jgi:hypothetical protein